MGASTLLLLGFLSIAQAKSPDAPSERPDALGPARQLSPGVVLHEVALEKGKEKRLWIYLPSGWRSRPDKIPCIFIAPAGSRGYHGMRLEEADRAEHVPYAEAGFAVVAYEIDGYLPKEYGDAELPRAMKEFKASKAGVLNGKSALDWAFKNLPCIDKAHVYAAGHSSAGTVALLMAESDRRVKGCIAYAPVVDVPRKLEAWLPHGEVALPGYGKFVVETCALKNAGKLKCPLFLHCAEKDRARIINGIRELVLTLREVNEDVTCVWAPEGDHYSAMIQDGLPRGIQWIQSRRTQKG